jgi:hypothetical protein
MNKETNSYFKQQITYALNNLLMSNVREEDAPCSAYQHFATGIEMLYNLVPEYTIDDKECSYLLKELLTNQDILHGRITCDEGCKIMDDLDIYNVNNEI